MGRGTDHGDGFIQRFTAFGQGEGLALIGHGGAFGHFFFGHGFHIRFTLAVNGASAGDGNVGAAFGVDETALVETGGVLCAPEIGDDFGEVVDFGGSQQHGIPLNVQVNTVLQVDTAAKIPALFQNDLTAAVGGAVINGCLNGSGVQCDAVTNGTVGSYIAVFHG